METIKSATSGGAGAAVHIDWRTDLAASSLSRLERAGDNVTLVVIDMQAFFLDKMENSAQPLVDAVIRQIKQARKMGWGIVVLEMKPARLGLTIEPIMEALKGYERFVQRCKHTPSGAKQVIDACIENQYGMGLFRITGVLLDACVIETVTDLMEREPVALVRLIEEACSTDFDLPGAWKSVLTTLHDNLRAVVSSEMIDSQEGSASRAA